MRSDIKCIKKILKLSKYRKIFQFFNDTNTFSLTPTGHSVIKKEVRSLNRKKSTPQRDIAVKVINFNANSLSPLIARMFNECTENSIFSGALKFFNIFLWFSMKEIINTENKIIGL